MTTPEQTALDQAQAAFDQAHARWEQATIARRTAEAQARSGPMMVSTETGRILENQYRPEVAAQLRRLRDLEQQAFEARAEAGEAVPLARQAAAAAAAKARHAALYSAEGHAA